MSPRRRIPRRRTHLAAPLVMTAVLGSAAATAGAGCGSSETVFTNPGRPDEPPAVDTTAPTATESPTAAPSGAPLADIPSGGEGRVEKQADGTCLYFFPVQSGHCPPGASCNPGPPREPLAVKCPADGKTAP